ncbi:MAG TPA: YcxB family protein [Flavitalea sp.]|nr:YcxB family protein [Flavitalea sp.]
MAQSPFTMLSLRFSLTEDEYFLYNYHTTWASPARKGYRRRHYMRIFALYSAVAGLYIIANYSHRFWFDLFVFAVIAVVYFSLIPYFVRLSVRKRVREILRQPGNHHILEPAEVIIMETGIIDKDDLSETRYDWEAIVKKEETAHAFYLYTNSYHAIVIPQRILKDPDKKELESLLNRHLPLSSEFSG